MTAARIPGPPIPMIAGLSVFSDSFKTPMKLYQRYGKLVSLNATRSGGNLMAFGPEYNRQVFTNTADFYTIDSDSFPVKLPRDTALYRLWNNGLLQMNGERHDQQRRLMLPALHKKQINHYRTLMIAETEKRLGSWKVGDTVDVLKEMRALTAAIAIRAFLGMDPETDGMTLHRLFSEWAKMIQSPVNMAMPVDIPGSPFHRMLVRSEEVEQELAALLGRKRAALKDSETQDGLSALIQAQDEDGTRLTENEIMGQIGTFYIAGHETTASTLTWALLLLAQHPDVYTQLVEELSPLKGSAPSAEQGDQFLLLDKVIKETMRLFPPLPFVVRTSRVPFSMGGAEFPARISVGLSAFVTHRLPEIYSDADKFLPERWDGAAPSPYEYIPFSAGPRMCLGASFAMAEMKIVLPVIIGCYRLANPPNARVDYQASIFAAPRGGLPMEIRTHNGTFPPRPIRGSLREVVDLPRN